MKNKGSRLFFFKIAVLESKINFTQIKQDYSYFEVPIKTDDYRNFIKNETKFSKSLENILAYRSLLFVSTNF